MRGTVRRLSLLLLSMLLGGILTVATGAVIYLENREDLSVWHRVDLEEEYRSRSDAKTFSEYLELEDRLFLELDQKVVGTVAPGHETEINRYARGSLSSSDRWPRNWNRSYEMPVAEPTAVALMLHGMSDSPYSTRALAQRLHDRGVYVVGVRYPGHGTAPASLTETRWQDMYGAVELAARHAQALFPRKPYYVFGYSTGGPLAVELALQALTDETLVVPDGMVFFSPAMGITPLAALAPWQARLGRVLGFEKLAWNSIEPEYDPFKYRSFPLNAAIQVWQLARHVDKQLAASQTEGRLVDMPPILSFQSVVDNTIEASAVRSVLYERLPSATRTGVPHQLVVYDFNRGVSMGPLLAKNPAPELQHLLRDSERNYEFSVVMNQKSRDFAVQSRTGARGDLPERVCEIAARWPDDAYSLAHIALPFPPDDSLYGGEHARDIGAIMLGHVVLRGEVGALRVSAAGFLRQTFNPFFDYQFERLVDFMALPDMESPDADPSDSTVQAAESACFPRSG